MQQSKLSIEDLILTLCLRHLAGINYLQTLGPLLVAMLMDTMVAMLMDIMVVMLMDTRDEETICFVEICCGNILGLVCHKMYENFSVSKLFSIILKKLPTFKITDICLLKTFTDKNTDKNLIKFLTKMFLKSLIGLLIIKHMFLCSEKLYFINLSIYCKKLYLRILSCKNLCFKKVSGNDIKISYNEYYLKTIETNEIMFLKTYPEKIKNNFSLKYSYNIPLIKNKLGYFINTLNIICQFSVSIITKINFSKILLIKMYSLQVILSKFITSKFIFEFFVYLFFSVGTLCVMDLVCLKIKYMIQSTFLEISKVILTFMDLKYMFIHLIHLIYYEKYE